MESMAIGLAADAAVAAFHAGSSARALAGLAGAVEGLGHLDPNRSLKAAYCHRVVRHAVLWMQTQIEKREALSTVSRCDASRELQQSRAARRDALPLGPIDIAWYMLRKPEIASGQTVGIYAFITVTGSKTAVTGTRSWFRNWLADERHSKAGCRGIRSIPHGIIGGLAFVEAGGKALQANLGVSRRHAASCLYSIGWSARAWQIPSQ